MDARTNSLPKYRDSLARKTISERMISRSRRVMDLTSGFDFLSVDGLNAEFAISHFFLLPSSGAVH